MRWGEMFAGAGGGLLGAVILGHELVMGVEGDGACCRVLRRWFPGMEVVEGDVRGVEWGEWVGRLDCLAAGFPCQDISVAGGGKGIDGERSGLVWEVFKAVDVLGVGVVFLENSPAIRRRGRDEILEAFDRRGYEVADGVLGASEVGALHRRDRWWCLAWNEEGGEKIREWRSGFLADVGRPGRIEGAERGWLAGSWGRELGCGLEEIVFVGEALGAAWNQAHPHLCGVVHGVPPGLDRVAASKAIEMLGNAQVPLQMALAFLLLSEEA